MAISNRRLRALSATALASSAWLSLVPPAYGQTWQGDVSGDWFDGGNWSTGAAPMTASTAIIDSLGSPNAAIIGAASAGAAQVFVGGIAHASLEIKNGGSLTSSSTIIGNRSVNAAAPAASETGEVTITGVGSALTSDFLYVGYYGTGELTIENSGKALLQVGSIGQQAGSFGTVDVTGSDALWRTTGGTLVGDSGTGTLNISQGASGISYSASVGNAATGDGTANVTGNGSLWQITNGNLTVGQSGAGELNISGGAEVEIVAARTVIGSGSGSTGTVTVSGTGSTLSSKTDIRLGVSSTGTTNVSAGGKVESAGIYLGFNSNGVGNLNVTGTDSRTVATSSIILGYNGRGTATISNGGTLAVESTLGALGTISVATLSGSQGTLNIGAAEGQAAAAAGEITASKVQFGAGTGTVVFNHTGSAYNFDPAFAGSGAVRHLAGSSLFTADSSAFTGTTSVLGGKVILDGKLGGNITVRTSGTLTGSGHATGNVDLTGGGRLSGESAKTLRIDGNVVMDNSSGLSVALGGVSSTALFDVGGNLTLDGTLNVTDAGGFGAGIYRLFDYDGTLTDGGVVIGTTPSGVTAGQLSVQTSVSKQVNLLSTTGVTLSFWDGGNAALHGNNQVDGGSGTWRADGSNWTAADGALNGAYHPNPSFAVFQKTGGVVTVDDGAGALAVTGMQFAADGYRVEGDAIALQGTGGTTTIRVGDGSAAGADMTATIASSLTGNTTLVKNDRGTLTLTGLNTYTGGTQVVAGKLVGNVGSIRGDLGNAGTVVFDQDTNASFSGTVVGLDGKDGTMIKRGAGILTLTGASVLDWTVEDGEVVADASRFGGDVAIKSGAELTFEQDVNTVYAGKLSGAGDFNLAGTGALTLTGDSSAFTGSLTILGGHLVVGTSVGGKLGGTTTIGAGGFLGGIGTIGRAGSTLTVAAGGVHAPGNSIGVQTVAGNYANHGTLQIEATPTNADKLIVMGSTDITGATLDLMLQPTSSSGWGLFSNPVTLIDKRSVGAVTGTFAGTTKNLLFLDSILDYAGGDGNDVTLQLKRNDIAFADVGRTRNQIASAAAIEALGSSHAAWRAIALAGDDASARAGFDTLSGEIHASLKTALIEDSRFVRNAMNDRLHGEFDGTDPELATVWGQVFGAWGHTDGDGNAATLDHSTGGFLMGVDTGAFEGWRFGAIAGYGHTSFDVTARGSSGSSDNYHVGLYGGTAWGAFALRTGASYSWHGVSTNRRIAFGGLNDRLESDYDAATAQVFGELGYGIELDPIRFEPFANLAYVNVDTDAFSETGGATPLSGSGDANGTAFTTLGLRAETVFDLNGVAVTAKGMAGWRHAFGDVTPTSVHSFSKGAPFTISGVPVTRNAAIVEAGLDIALSSDATFGLSYAAQVSSGATDQAVKAGLKVKF